MQSENDITQNDDVTTPWYALRLFSIKQQAIDDELKERGFTTFIPKQVVDFRDKSNKLRHELRPVVRNLIFLKKAMDEKEFRKEIFNFPYKVSVIKKGRDTNEMAEISAKEMHEFQLMCNPKIFEKIYIRRECQTQGGHSCCCHTRAFERPDRKIDPQQQEILSSERRAGNCCHAQGHPLVLPAIR